MDILINKLNRPLNESNEAINNIVVKHSIISPVKRFYEVSENKNFDAANLSQNIDFNIGSGHSNKSRVENKLRSEIDLDKMDKPSFNEVADNAINQMIVLIENMCSLYNLSIKNCFQHQKIKSLLPL